MGLRAPQDATYFWMDNLSVELSIYFLK